MANTNRHFRLPRQFSLAANQRGLTIVELMMVLIIAGLILALAVPAYQGTIRRNAIISEANRLKVVLNYARSQAVSLGQVVTIRSSGGNANDWAQGWTIYADTGGEGNEDGIDGIDRILKTLPGAGSGLDVITDDGAAGSNDRYISFNPNGTLMRGGVGITIDVCDQPRSQIGRQITVSVVGRVTVDEVAAASCG